MKRWALLMIAVAALLVLAEVICFWQKPLDSVALAKKWHEQAYGLDESEVVRVVAELFPAEHLAEFTSRLSWPMTGKGQLKYVVEKSGCKLRSMTDAHGTILSAVQACGSADWLYLRWPDYEIFPLLGPVVAQGDWIVRGDASVERRMHAMASILSQMSRRDLVVECRPARREVIVIRGQWKAAISDNRFSSSRRVYLFTDHLGAASTEDRSGGTDWFLRVLAGISRRHVSDETEGPIPASILWVSRMSFGCIDPSEDQISRLLENLSRQTGLEFVSEPRIVAAWYVSERDVTGRGGERR